MDFKISLFKLKLDKFHVVRGVGVIKYENKEYYVSKDTPLTSFKYRENITKNSMISSKYLINDYYANYCTLYCHETTKDLVIKYTIYDIQLGQNNKIDFEIPVKTTAPLIAINLKNIDIPVFEGCSTFTLPEELKYLLELNLLKNTGGHYAKIIR